MWKANAKPSSAKPTKSPKKAPKGTLAAIQQLEAARAKRRQSAEKFRRERAEEDQRNEAAGRPGDVDFQRMITQYRRDENRSARAHKPPGETRINICVRKRPISTKEVARRDFDAVSCVNPRAIVHSCKLKVDGITKYLENQEFAFDHTFHESDSTNSVYEYTVQPLIDHVFRRGRGTCFAYGQTGSGKTYTMTGIQTMAARDLFLFAEREGFTRRGFRASVTFFEIYGGRCSDLLHGRNKITVREDGSGRIVCQGLKEATATSADGLMALVERGNRARTTHATAANETSSRSHAICELILRDETGKLFGKMSLIDLAGSERAADSRHHNRQRRVESAEINKSLLALKECIRALDTQSSHVPFRASKLTLVLKDSFVSRRARVVMIATVSPAMSAADHTQNTLRYADRVKEKKVGKGGPSSAAPSAGAGAGGAVRAPPSAAAVPMRPSPPRGGHDGGRLIDRAPDAVRCSPLVMGDDGGGHKIRPSLSPQASQLKELAIAAREGKITKEEKARAKERILRGEDPTPIASAPRMRRQRSAGSVGRGGGGGAAAAAPSPSPAPSAYAGAPDSAHKIPRERRVWDVESDVRRAPKDVHVTSLSDDDGDSTDEELRRDFKAVPVRHAAGRGSRGPASLLSRARPEDSPDSDSKFTDPDDDRSPAKDLRRMHETLRHENLEDGLYDEKRSGELLALHEAVGMIVEEEETVLNNHMAAIQEHAELLTEEGRLLSQVQGQDVVDYDIDAYASRLDEILRRKLDLTSGLLRKLTTFREHLALEEQVSKRLG